MPPTAPSSSVPWPLVARDAELARIADARSRGDCRGVVVGAPAGVGKSRLARVACDAARSEGAVVAWVQATSSAATVPLGAFAGLLPEAVRTDDALELMRRSVDSLRRNADGRPVVLGVDDGQLVDPVSAAGHHAREEIAPADGRFRTAAPPQRDAWRGCSVAEPIARREVVGR